MKPTYRLIDIITNKLLLKTDDYESVIAFLIKCVSYNKYRHEILKDKRKISLLELIDFKRERDRILGKSIKYDNSDDKFSYIDKLLNDIEP